MIIKNIENKIKLSFWITTLGLLTAIIISGLSFFTSYKMVKNSRKQIYVLDNHNVPILLQRTTLNVNRRVEKKAHVELFHSLFFSFPPDKEYIQKHIKRALNLADNSAASQYANLKETGYYTSIISASAMVNISADSIVLSKEGNHFVFYGKQRIQRPSSIVIRNLITEGDLDEIKRSRNNPHGILIKNWTVIQNKDLDYINL